MLLSIVIPVYKVEKYIYKCLDSIFSQHFPENEVEVIVVNDGTPDNSMQIVHDFSIFSSLHIVNQKNQGLSVARNNGITIAQGEYIWCIDSDDWIANNSIEFLLEALKSCVYDMIATKVSKVYEDSEKVEDEDFRVRFHKVVKGKEYLFNGYPESPTQRFIYKKSFLAKNSLFYTPGILHEDVDYCIRALYLADSIKIMDTSLYLYLQRSNGSITSSFGIKNFVSLYDIYKKLVSFGKYQVARKDHRNWSAICAKLLLVLFLRISQSSNNKNDEVMSFYNQVLPIIRQNIWRILLGTSVKRRYIKDVILITLLPSFAIKYYSNR